MSIPGILDVPQPKNIVATKKFLGLARPFGGSEDGCGEEGGEQRGEA